MSVLPSSAAALDEAAEALLDARSASPVVPCLYCRADIAADEFEFWTAARRLLSATCPHCQRRVTLAVATWRRWRRLADAREQVDSYVRHW